MEPKTPRLSLQNLSNELWGVLGFLALLIVNVSLFLVQSITGGADGVFTKDGGLFTPAVQQAGEWWRIVSAGFLHADYAHIFGNMTAMLLLGLILSLKVGGQRAIAAYFVGLFAAALGGIILQPSSLQIGASGAVFGLAGALCAVGWKSRSFLYFVFAFVWLLWSTYSTLITPGVAWGEHFGGALGGILFGFLLYSGKSFKNSPLENKQDILPLKESLLLAAILCGLLFLACIKI